MIRAVLLLTLLVRAEWKPEYSNLPPEVRAWYSSRTLTEAAQKRFLFKSCCAHSDVVKTQFRVNSIDGTDEWFWLEQGRWRRVPPDVIHWHEPTPTGQPVLFVFAGKETCFFPGDSGI